MKRLYCLILALALFNSHFSYANTKSNADSDKLAKHARIDLNNLPPSLSRDEIPIEINNYNLNKVLVAPFKARAQYFEQYKDDYVVLFDKLVEPEMVKQQVYLSYMLRFAIDSDVALPELASIGLSHTKYEGYAFDLAESPHFASVSGLFSLLKRRYFRKIQQDLLDRGFAH